MPPKHEWRCEQCKTIVEVVRKIGKHGVPPEKEEQECECKAPEFKKVITSPPRAAYGAGWSPYGYGGGKGNWALLLGVLGWQIVKNTVG